MPFFSGFAGEFGRSLAQARSEDADRAERRDALEGSVLQHLATSPDSEIASHGVLGLLDLADPNRKRATGLSTWLGRKPAGSAIPTIRGLVQSGRQVPDQPAHVESSPAEIPGTLPGTPMAAPTAPGGEEAPSASQTPASAQPSMGPPGPADVAGGAGS